MILLKHTFQSNGALHSSSDIGSAEGFNYSDALAEHGGEWTLSNLDAYLENTREFIPGNKMSFPGLRDAQDRADFSQIQENAPAPAPVVSAEPERVANSWLGRVRSLFSRRRAAGNAPQPKSAEA